MLKTILGIIGIVVLVVGWLLFLVWLDCKRKSKDPS